ncbi:hypothetical protein [Streptomyces sp. NPDC055060]
MAGDEYEYERESEYGLEYDALMLALTEDSVTDESAADGSAADGFTTDASAAGGSRLDPALAAERAAAVADVALLREHIGVVGRALAAPEPAPRKVPTPVPDPLPRVRPVGVRRRRVTVALGLAAAVAAVSLVGGSAWLAMESGGGMSKSSDDSGKGAAPGAADQERDGGGPDSGDQKPGGYVACARLIVEGTVKRVEPVPGGEKERIVLDVTRYYKPDKGAGRITFVMDTDVDPRLHPGDRTLIGIPKGQASPDLWSDGTADLARDRAFVRRELREGKGRGKGTTC